MHNVIKIEQWFFFRTNDFSLFSIDKESLKDMDQDDIMIFQCLFLFFQI